VIRDPAILHARIGEITERARQQNASYRELEVVRLLIGVTVSFQSKTHKYVQILRNRA